MSASTEAAARSGRLEPYPERSGQREPYPARRRVREHYGDSAVPIIFVLILVIVIVAAIVAAAGDRMGHRAARSKIRLGNLRPRTVSTLIAVITGVLISLVTYGVVFALWKDFREAMLTYGKVKQDLAAAHEEQEGLQANLATAQGDLDKAEEQRKEAEAQASKARGELFEVASDLSETKQELHGTEEQVESLKGEFSELRRLRDELKEDVEGYEARMEELRHLFVQARTELEAYQEGEIVLRKGTNLAYQRVHGDDLGNLQGVLQGALNRVNINLSGDGLAIDGASAGEAQGFIDEYPYEDESVIIISSARNVVEGEDVLLAFESMPLKPLIAEGEVIMEVLVEEYSARIWMQGAESREINVPVRLDADSLAGFTAELRNAFIEGAEALGFLPDLRFGAVATPVGLLDGMAQELIERERPFVIEFIAKETLTALDGLANATVRLSKPSGD
ncbi:DUF3084 domain-containing protein [bacterium]|nr:DUF3084 domain-containing protein [bacterium]